MIKLGRNLIATRGWEQICNIMEKQVFSVLCFDLLYEAMKRMLVLLVLDG